MRSVYTIGYGGRSIIEFIGILKSYGVEAVIDVRRWNKTLKQPEFSGKNLQVELSKNNIQYYWFPALGGFRKFGVDVEDIGIATCFKSNGFRAYATYITRCDEVKHYLEKLVELAKHHVITIMCCEKYPWFCHRKILSDYLVAKGFKVLHIIDREQVIEHVLSECAIVENNELKYK